MRTICEGRSVSRERSEGGTRGRKTGQFGGVGGAETGGLEVAGLELECFFEGAME